MADSRLHGSGFRLDIQQLQLEAQHRWFRPAEICEILQNYQKFHIASEPPYKPLSGSLFLFDRKVLRYFRKDGHIWRKKKDGKTVKEAHEKLKVGSVDVLHCYYAHGEENENFQRRSYWLLEEDFMHIVFVHYLEVKGNKTSAGCIKDVERLVPKFQGDSSLSSSSSANNHRAASANTDSPSPTSTLTSAYEESESDYHQASSKSASLEVPLLEHSAGVPSSHYLLPYSGNQSISGGDYSSLSLEAGTRDSDGSSFVSGYQGTLDLACWEEALEHHPTYRQTLPSKPLTSANCAGQLLAGDFANKQETGHHRPIQANLQVSLADQAAHLNKWPMDQILGMDSEYDFGNGTSQQKSRYLNGQNLAELILTYSDEPVQQPIQCNLRKQHPDAESNFMERTNLENIMATAGTGNYSLIAKHSLLEGSKKEDSLKKADSFSRWIAKEFGDVEELHTQSNNGITWSLVESGDLVDDSIQPQLQLGTDSMNPSLSQDQLFSIVDFTPSWAYSDKETEVLIRGIFLKSQQEVEKFTWSCMFGEVEVPAQIIAEGGLCCYAPPHRSGVVPFYITCSNRLACSEVREFEYRVGSIQSIDAVDVLGGSSTWICLHMRLERICSLDPVDNANLYSEIVEEKQFVVRRLVSLLEEEKKYSTTGLISEKDFSESQMKAEREELKDKLYSWLLHKVTEDGKGPNVLDEEGQGVLHLAAALGYNWALKPIVVSGVNVDFRDVNGWTALHWAAFCGREDTVVALVSLGAAPGALTDPSPEYPLGRTPAELASGSGHKGISGFLAESSLTMHLSSLTMNDSKEDGGPDISGLKAIQSISERTATPSTAGAVPDMLSLTDSLAAVCNATQAATRIHQIFRMQSFQRKQLVKHDSDELGPLDEHSISLVAFKTSRLGQHNGIAHDAAICIQKKFRGWKKRKEFLIIRQRIVKIQAHVRGHQVRKKYTAITWSVGILEKVILRWRRKGSGLRGFRSDAVLKGPKTQDIPSQEDDYDFLREGRKQAEERLHKALARVKSMAQYPEGRAQYRRLLTVAEGFRESQDTCNMSLSSSEVTANGDEDLIDIQTLLDDDTFMSIAFE